ncbi:MAG: DNA alkylation repair protein, partial [Muribaculaceae bacterium]|nr:DNA alkylation repair protein [Muribaculaceae bacterium]
MEKEKVTAADIEALLKEQENERQRKVLMRFFKTGKGEYGEGDAFLGLKVPQTRTVVKEAKGLVSLAEIEKLLHSRWHEVRLA